MPALTAVWSDARRFNTANLTLLLSVAVTMLVILIQTGWTIVADRAASVEQAEIEQIAAVRSLEEHAYQTLQDADRALGATLDSIDAAGAAVLTSQQALRKILLREHQGTAHIQSLRFITSSGVSTVNSFTPPLPTLDISDRQYVRYMMLHPERQSSLIGAPIKSRYDGA